MFYNNLIPVILRPTRVGASSATLIDHIFISNPEYFKKSGVILSNISDHYSAFSAFDLKLESFKESFVEIPKRIVGGSYWDSLNIELSNFDWNCIKNYDSVEGGF